MEVSDFAAMRDTIESISTLKGRFSNEKNTWDKWYHEGIPTGRRDNDDKLHNISTASLGLKFTAHECET